MDYEQKYKEALERARDLHDNHSLGMPFVYQTCEDIFPQLRESDDEKIRKALHNFFWNAKEAKRSVGVGISNEEILAWLEKQGEQKPIKWSEEDEIILSALIKSLQGEVVCFTNKDYIYWLKSIKERAFPQSKQKSE